MVKVVASLKIAVTAMIALPSAQVAAVDVPHHGFRVGMETTEAGCVACHDGTVARHASTCSIMQCTFADPHVMGTPYPPPAATADFVPAALVEAVGIRLPGGKISCISCHDLAVPEKNHLTVDNSGSALCLACHIR